MQHCCCFFGGLVFGLLLLFWGVGVVFFGGLGCVGLFFLGGELGVCLFGGYVTICYTNLRA